MTPPTAEPSLPELPQQLPYVPTQFAAYLQLLAMRPGPMACERTEKSLSQAMPILFLEVDPAAMRTMLKVLWVLQTVVDDVLPSIDMSVTLRGPIALRLFLILLTSISVLLFELTELAL